MAPESQPRMIANFETEGEAIESGFRRTLEGRDVVMRSLVRAVYRFRDATLVAEKKDDFGNALQNFVPEVRASGRSGCAEMRISAGGRH